MKSWIVFLLAFALLAAVVSAQTFPQYQDEYVNDFAGMFTADETAHLRSVLSEVRENTTAEVVLVTVAETAPLTPSEYGTELFNRWGIGKKENDNGLLLLYAKKENKFWVTTGYGMEGILPDSKIGRMLDDYYVPRRDAGNTTKGIIAFTEEVSKVIDENRDELISGNAGLSETFIYAVNLFIILIFLGVFVFGFAASRGLLSPKCPKDGLKMKFIRNEGQYAVYECPNGHIVKKKRRARSVWVGGVAGGGFGGGGFGGGGFGGGGSGGGGAGR